MSAALRLMIYDRTCTRDLLTALDRKTGDSIGARVSRAIGRTAQRLPGPGLSHAWASGGVLYSALGRIDDRRGFDNWGEALRWLADYPGDRPIAEIQFWGHGKWGNARMDAEHLGLASLEGEHDHRAPLAGIRDRMVPGTGLWWFRTCETFGAVPGQRFAEGWTDFFGCRAAGHTYIIGPWQSGLHSLGPGERPTWSVEEGLSAGTPEQPTGALWSRPSEPNTISFLHGAVPAGY